MQRQYRNGRFLANSYGDAKNLLSEPEAHDVAMDMVLLKVARIATARKIDPDNYDDLIGYATLAKKLATLPK